MSFTLKKSVYSKQSTLIFALIFAAIAILGFASLISPAASTKIAAPNEAVSSQGTYSGYLTRVVIVTFTMVVVLIIGLRIYKQQMVLKGKNNLAVTIMGRHYINDKQYLLKVNIESKNMLLGITESNITFLTELQHSEAEADESSFGSVLDLKTNKESII